MPDSPADWIERLGQQTLPAPARNVRQIDRLPGGAVATNAGFERILARDPGFAIGICQ